MKNVKKIAIIAALTIPAGFVWHQAQTPSKLATTHLIPVPMAAAQPAISGLPPAPAPHPVLFEAPPAPIADKIGTDGAITHVVQPGETVSSLAADLDGKDSKTNRDAIIAANPSLAADPDRLLAGKAYRVPATDAPVAAVPADEKTADAAVPEVATPQPRIVQSTNAKDLRYTAKAGDTLSKLAGAFLGNDDQAHQEMIINANPSLRANPDKLLIGTTYEIPVPQGLSVTEHPSAGNVAARPSTQPDSDQIIAASAPRMLRYTAVAGDSVSTLAIQLLGSDTPEARRTIINSNPSLRLNPDRLVEGQTYSIPAPMAASAQ